MTKKRVLIVDDSPENIQVLVEALNNKYTILATQTGASALKLARTSPQPDIILLDIMMPEMDGYEVCRRLKESATTKKIPVIFVTSLTEVQDEAMGLELGAVDYLTKPVNPAIVQARVSTHLNLRQAQQDTEKVLSKTLQGAVAMLTDIIGWLNPVAASRSERCSRLVGKIARELGVSPVWPVELAARLSQLGSIGITSKSLKSLYAGNTKHVSSEEVEFFKNHPALGADLVQEIPLLGRVAELVAGQCILFDGDVSKPPSPQQILRCTLDYDQHILQGALPEAALLLMETAEPAYDHRILETLGQVTSSIATGTTAGLFGPLEIRLDMILDQDVISITGMCVASKGTIVNETALRVIHRFGANGMIEGKIRAMIVEPE
ncbi:response regulator [Marinifilum sp. JC120]|nr:response regulator [Marinifilum sp. JC120]